MEIKKLTTYLITKGNYSCRFTGPANMTLSEIKAYIPYIFETIGDTDFDADYDDYLIANSIGRQQKVELLSLPNWATWTAQEAETNVGNLITNGIAQETAEAAVAAASNIASLRPILLNLIRAVYSIETILTAIAKCIIYIRDILKP